MKVGMNLLLWTANPTAREHASLLKQIKQWGFDGVEFPLMSIADADVKEFNTICDDLGLGRTTILALGANAADPANPDEMLRQAAVDTIKQAIDRTRAIGADVLTGPLFQGLGRFTGAGPTPQDWDRARTVLMETANHAAGMHVRLALEPLNRFEMFMVNTVADGVRFVESMNQPNVGLLLDTHHSNIEEEDAAAAWRKAGKHIFHVHISENHRGVPGRGHAATPAIFSSLKAVGYTGWATIEAFGTKVKELIPPLHLWRPFFEREEEVAVDGVKFIRKRMAEAGF